MSALTLPSTASAQELDDELIFQNVLLSTLDPGADDYEARREELEEGIRELQRRLDTSSATSPDPSQHSASRRDAGAVGMDDILDDTNLLGANARSRPTNRTTSLDRNSASFSHPGVGSKRGYPEGLTHNPSEHRSKRLTPEPAHANWSPSPSPSPSFDLAERRGFGATERALRRHRDVEAQLKRQMEDEALARQLQKHMSSNTYRSVPGSSTSQPRVQTTIGSSGHFQRPAPPPPVKAGPTSSSPLYSSRVDPVSRHGTGSPTITPRVTLKSTAVKPEFNKARPGSAVQKDSSKRRGSVNMIDLTASDSDEELSEIAPTGFTPSQRHPRPLPSRSLQSERPSMPGSYPEFDDSLFSNKSDPSRYTSHNNTVGLKGRGRPGESHATPRTQPSAAQSFAELQKLPSSSNAQPPRYGYPGSTIPAGYVAYGHGYPQVPAVGYNMPSAFDRYGTFESSNNVLSRHLASGSYARPPGYGSHPLSYGSGTHEQPFNLDDDDDDEEDFDDRWGGYRSGMYAGKEDLYRNRYDAIANYDPQQTKEEINALLMNIRPDEDMPAHLRVQTPPGMAVQLHKYQELGLTWLKNCEEGSNQGGILADDMGLGKTIQMLSLIVSNRSDDPSCRQTLVVAPVALMRQWKSEILTKVKPGPHALKVFTHHGTQKKASFAAFQQYDVVLTTFGSLASELKKMEIFKLRQQHDHDARPTVKERCVFLAPEAKWFRVILDEAQCIKNKNTQTAKAARMLNARYRFCMTGTPMMNNVEELYSLIAFLRMKPYAAWEKFRLDFSMPLKSSNAEVKDNAMQKFQAVCKAIMLRRTKKSMFEGKPILILPDRTTEVNNPAFSADERSFYDSVEGRTQLLFNKYLKAGTVGRSYSAILVLLLRLRQACCHPHLIKDFGVAATADVTPDALLELARQLEDPVVVRIREKDGMFECPVCYDATVNPAIFIPCGHDTCSDCFARITDPAMALAAGNETGGAQAKCPECRGAVDAKRITDYHSFKRVHQRDKLTPEELAAEDGALDDDDDDIDSDSDSESDDADDRNEKGDLRKFIVPDDEVEFEDGTDGEADDSDGVKNEAPKEEEVDECMAGPSTIPSESKHESKRKSKKGKGKGKRKPKETLAELKKIAGRSAKAKKAYLRRLRRNWVSSAKIDKTIELLHRIMEETDEKVLIFSQWTSLLDLLEVPIDREKWGYRRYDGSMNAQARGDAVEDFSSTRKNVRIMLLSLKAGNAGLNLNTASQVIILDPFWNPYIEEQAIDRAHRIGQAREVTVHRLLVPDTVEDRILALQEKKRALISTALDEEAAQGIARLGVHELAYLFGITATPQQRVNYVPQNARA